MSLRLRETVVGQAYGRVWSLSEEVEMAVIFPRAPHGRAAIPALLGQFGRSTRLCRHTNRMPDGTR